MALARASLDFFPLIVASDWTSSLVGGHYICSPGRVPTLGWCLRILARCAINNKEPFVIYWAMNVAEHLILFLLDDEV